MFMSDANLSMLPVVLGQASTSSATPNIGMFDDYPSDGNLFKTDPELPNISVLSLLYVVYHRQML